MSEIEFSLLSKRRLARRIANKETPPRAYNLLQGLTPI